MRKSGNPQSVLQAGQWLLGSGIQHRGPQKNLKGGVSAWYELDKKIYPFLYSEITGYALSTLVFLNRIHPHKKWIEHAQLAAQWLSKNAIQKNGGVKTRLYLVKHYVSPNYSFDQGRVYAFDTAMVGYGLMQLYRLCPTQPVLDSAQRVLNFLIGSMRKEQSIFYPYYDSKRNKCGEDFGKWSDQAGSFHVKCALFLIDAYRLLGIAACQKASTALLNAALKQQKRDGRFVTGEKDGSTHLHPHSYTLEGLLYGAVHLKREDCLDAAFRGFEWMLKGVSTDGSVSSIYENGRFSHHERSDIVAQVLRIGSILYGLAPKDLQKYLPILDKVRRHLLLFQYQGDKKQAGGFIYGFATDGLIRNHLNTWATMFAIQALWMHEEFVVRKNPVCLDAFV